MATFVFDLQDISNIFPSLTTISALVRFEIRLYGQLTLMEKFYGNSLAHYCLMQTKERSQSSNSQF